jgi:hypothetical protein
VPSVLGDSIIDSLVSVLDDLRGTVNPLVGNRQWNVAVVRRTWPSGEVGDYSAGPPTLAVTTITPQPLVVQQGDEKGLHYEMEAGGREERGDVTLREVSLAYSEDQLAPRGLADGVEFFYRLTDAMGQNLETRHFIPVGAPVADRVKDIGWTVTLRRRHLNDEGTEL